jgi:hypothetical protein
MKRICATCLMLMALALPSFAADNRATIKNILEESKQEPKVGMIHECNLDGKQIFTVSYNAHDYGPRYFAANGASILMNCSTARGRVADESCKRITDCKPVYATEKNIYNEKPIDLYKANSKLP